MNIWNQDAVDHQLLQVLSASIPSKVNLLMKEIAKCSLKEYLTFKDLLDYGEFIVVFVLCCSLCTSVDCSLLLYHYLACVLWYFCHHSH